MTPVPQTKDLTESDPFIVGKNKPAADEEKQGPEKQTASRRSWLSALNAAAEEVAGSVAKKLAPDVGNKTGRYLADLVTKETFDKLARNSEKLPLPHSSTSVKKSILGKAMGKYFASGAEKFLGGVAPYSMAYDANKIIGSALSKEDTGDLTATQGIAYALTGQIPEGMAQNDVSAKDSVSARAYDSLMAAKRARANIKNSSRAQAVDLAIKQRADVLRAVMAARSQFSK